ncbi:MAG: MG2 domain-containing protein, partial [Terracidiphilus sp.]
MRLRELLAAVLLLPLAAPLPAAAKDPPRSFSLSTSRTFAPGESVKIQLFARNVPELEFRVYKVRDPQKFFAGLKDLHSFGAQSSSPGEQIDQRTWIERLHDFKAHLWWLVRHFFRGQFTDEARDSFREQQGKLGKRSRVVGAAQFARVPILNSSQLVARWKLEIPPALVSETQQLPIDGLAAGTYLIEATEGTYKAYTVAIVTRIAVVERAANGRADLYVADRKTGAPVTDAEVALWADGRLQSSGKSDADGFATLTMTVRGGAQGAEPENVWIMARRGDDAALVTPLGYSFGVNAQSDLTTYAYTDRPVYRPGHTVHMKVIVRRTQDDALLLPTERTFELRVNGPDNKVAFDKELPVSAHGTVTADLDLDSDAALGYYSFGLVGGNEFAGSFYVEDYKKPEYQVTVKPLAPRVLQGNAIQAVIEARYFFGEPVAGAKVTYVVHTSTHEWWDEDDEDQSGDEADSDSDQSGDSDDDTYGETEQQEHEGVLDADGRLTVTVPVALDPKQSDQDYRIEARVTDVGDREVSGHATVLATYGSFRIGVEPVSYIFQGGQPVRVKVTAQDYDGKPVETPVHLSASRESWDSVTHQRSETPVASQDAATGADGTVLVDLPITGSGDFQVSASAQTPEDRTVGGRTWVWIWAGAGEWYNPNAQAQIVADKKTYKVGDTAHLLLVTGLSESWAVVTAEGDSVQMRRLIHSTGQSFAFDIPITQKAQPNLVVNAVIVHDNQVMTAQKSLKVPPVERTLTVTATPGKSQYLPGETGSFDVLALDSEGKPVEADLSFGVVDEALYSVRPDESGDIVAAFYTERYVELEPQTSFDLFISGQAGTR